MRHFLIRRGYYSIIAILGVTIAVFALSRLAGDPRSLLVSESPYGMSQDAWDKLGDDLHLDRALPIQYGYWLADILRGDLGTDMTDGVQVSKKIRQKFPATLKLGLAAWILATLVGVPLGILSAVKRNSFWDYSGRVFALFGQALPPFYIAIMGILIFSVRLRWLPVAGEGEGFVIRHYVLPVATLSWLAAASYLRLTRSAMLEILDSEFITLARAKGVSERKVIWKHALRNSLILPITMSGLLLAGFVTGTVVIETVFAWPGLGRLAVDAVANNNLSLVVGTTLVFGVIFIAANFIVDLSYMVIDPRIRFD